ncbi:cytochrome c oxidase assembly protein COX15 homolog [Galendromus occidentalis]|uniref:Cytochrome c oxidase assembly protein COX15 homolog n=1 Tax=Galendromus occidentalis TaxID=34638 RepID=A0AAJ6QNZ8_9ACAR|nr:cytochrome c oxidase assembly protein COX15 homolog [Galendromus occidentalis]
MIPFTMTRLCLRQTRISAARFLRKPFSQKLSARFTVTNGAAPSLKLVSGKDKLVGGWLLTCSGMAFGAVVLGGITRLTKSGLSMVDWHPFDEGRPRTEQDWQREFEKYQQFPEFKITNRDMTLEQFKSIYWMEYIHRMWGRTIGAVYFIPAAAFWALGYLRGGMKQRVVLMGGLLAGQGLMGWYMVKSGLEEKQGYDTTPRVSNLRLAAHLGTAFVLYAFLFRSGLQLLLPPQQLAPTQALRKLIVFGHMSKGLVFFTVLSGALVAGIEAGLVYNSFPKMADRWIPTDVLAFDPKWRNFFENPTTVQFDHRILGESVFCAITALYLYSRKVPMPPRARFAANVVLAAAWMQVALGITTLLNYVPTHLAATHQAGALTLFTTLLWLTHELKIDKKLVKTLRAIPK